VILRAPATLLIALLAVQGVSAGAGDVRDHEIPRPLRFDRPPVSASSARSRIWTPAGHPDDYRPREFPAVLRDPSLPAEPDGILWRRLRAQHPGLEPLDWAVPSRRAYDALMAERAAFGRAAPDTVRLLALRVDFLRDNAGDGSTTADGRFDLRDPDSAQVAVDPPPHNRSYFAAHLAAIDRYYRQISGGSIVLEWDVYPAEEDSAYHLRDTADYGPWTMGSDEEILATAERFVRDSFALADTSDDPPDFRRYDSFLLFHAGSDFQSDINRNSPYDIPSFNIQMATGSEVAVQDSTFFIDLILVVPETVSQDGFLGVLNGVLAHEYGHQLGFYDLYNVLNFYPMVGMFSLMDSGESLYGQVWDPYRETEVYVRGAIPSSVDPWQKLLFFRSGVNARWIDRSDTYELPAVELHNDLLLIPVGYPDPEPEPGEQGPLHLLSPEVFLLENRQYDLNGDGTVFLEADSATGVILGPRNVPDDMLAELGLTEPDTLGRYEVDYLLPGGGVLIWHVDTQTLADAFNYCYGCVNIFPDRHSVGVVEADGIPDLGDVYSVEWTGGALDYWSQETYSHLGSATDPSSAAGSGAFTGIDVTVLDSSAVTMRVAIDVGYRREGWPIFAGGVPGPEATTRPP
jgi:M6 family metalloprotease-like protein